MTALAYDFPAYSPGSRRHVELAEAGEDHLLRFEVERTRGAVAVAAAARIAKGQLTRADGDRIDAVFAAIAADLSAGDVWLDELRRGRQPPPLPATFAELRAGNGIAWADKVGALRREIEARRRGYPAEVDKGRLTAAQAREQLERLEAVHALYWQHGFAFDGTRDELRAHGSALLDQIEKQEIAA